MDATRTNTVIKKFAAARAEARKSSEQQQTSYVSVRSYTPAATERSHTPAATGRDEDRSKFFFEILRATATAANVAARGGDLMAVAEPFSSVAAALTSKYGKRDGAGGNDGV